MTNRTSSGLAYDVAGASAPTLLCLPGWCGPRTVFDPLIGELSKTNKVLVLDWRGHGESEPVEFDFGFDALVEDALELIRHEAIDTVVPVALSHAGFVAIELRRRLGSDRVPRLVLLDWMVGGAPVPFTGALSAMADPASTRAVVDQVIGMWAAGVSIASLDLYLKEMASAGDEMWQRAATAILGAFAAEPMPLETIGGLEPVPPTLHIYAQPADPEILAMQERFAADNSWFHVERLKASSHFPMFEVPNEMAGAIARFTNSR